MGGGRREEGRAESQELRVKSEWLARFDGYELVGVTNQLLGFSGEWGVGSEWRPGIEWGMGNGEWGINGCDAPQDSGWGMLTDAV